MGSVARWAAAVLLAVAVEGDWWSLVTPRDGGLRVSDDLILSYELTARKPPNVKSIEWTQAWPLAGHTLCVRTLVDDGNEEARRCFDGWGDFGHGEAGVFGISAAVKADFSGLSVFAEVRVEFWVAKGGAPASEVLPGSFHFELFHRCAIAAGDPVLAAGPAPAPRRVFDVFPFFNEGDILEVRLHEHDDIVDVYVPIEGSLTHAGGSKPLYWRDGLAREARFARFLPRIRAHVANLTLDVALGAKEAALERERLQRDATLDALLAAGATGRDLVIASDADEIARASTLRGVLACAEFVERRAGHVRGALPAYLAMNWHQYDFRWRSPKQWGLVAREGALLLEAAALGVGGSAGGDVRTASDWRRMDRTDRIVATGKSGLDRSFALDAGWHLSSFGGLDAVAEKLEAYIEAHVYDTPFYRDRDRLRRLIAGGVGYFELVSMDLDDEKAAVAAKTGAAYDEDRRKYFACATNRTDVPAYARAHRFGHLAALFGEGGCEGLDDRDRGWLQIDIAAARADRSQRGEYMIYNIFNSWADDEAISRQGFAPLVACPRSPAAGGLDAAAFLSRLEDQCRAAGLRKRACGLAEPVYARICADALATAADGDAATVRDRIDFVDSFHSTISVDDVPIVVTLDSTSDAAALAAPICEAYAFDEDQCANLVAKFENETPYDPWHPDFAVLDRDAWVANP